MLWPNSSSIILEIYMNKLQLIIIKPIDLFFNKLFCYKQYSLSDLLRNMLITLTITIFYVFSKVIKIIILG